MCTELGIEDKPADEPLIELAMKQGFHLNPASYVLAVFNAPGMHKRLTHHISPLFPL
jgi:hypothetical protein